MGLSETKKVFKVNTLAALQQQSLHFRIADEV